MCTQGHGSYRGVCNECRRTRRALERAGARVVIARGSSTTYRCGHDKVSSDRECRACKADTRKRYYEANKEREIAGAMASYHRRRKCGLVPKSTENVRKWRQNNPERAYELGAKENARRLRLLHNAFGSHTQAEWQVIVDKQRGKCADCGVKAKLEKDHIVPLSRGGSDMAVNLQGLCRQCNARKSNSLERGTQISVFDRVPA